LALTCASKATIPTRSVATIAPKAVGVVVMRI
jgi:hypothetical protein